MQELVVVRLAHAVQEPLSPAQEFAVELAVGGVLAVVYRYVREARIDELHEARDQLVAALLRPVVARPVPIMGARDVSSGGR